MNEDDLAEANRIRREMVESGQPAADLKSDAGRKWTTSEMQEEFDVEGFAAPFVVVRRKADRVRGTLEFTHHPRMYFAWREDT